MNDREYKQEWHNERRVLKDEIMQLRAKNRGLQVRLDNEGPALRKEVMRLQSIVDRMLTTADGVPVLESDLVWYPKYPNAPWMVRTVMGLTSFGVQDCYSTREAAEAAGANQCDDGETIGLACFDKIGNRALCQTCADKLMASDNDESIEAAT